MILCGYSEVNKLVTGWAQVNGRDELPIPVKVGFDEYYLMNRTLLLDLKIILLTAKKVSGGQTVARLLSLYLKV